MAHEELTQLGHKVEPPGDPDLATIETVANPHLDATYLVRFACPEFTTLCPVTGQPDFAHLVVDYVPAARLIESKSFKLYLGAFRNARGFHEDCTLKIAKAVLGAARPQWLRIGGYWYPRGGMPIDVFWQSGAPPAGLWLPEQAVAPYRGRG
jgi:7-cyano-7-deazaguanine reductase